MLSTLKQAVLQLRPKVIRGYIADCWAYCPEHYQWLLDVMGARGDAPETVKELYPDTSILYFGSGPRWCTCVRCGKELILYNTVSA